jgi:hypothetical protein
MPLRTSTPRGFAFAKLLLIVAVLASLGVLLMLGSVHPNSSRVALARRTAIGDLRRLDSLESRFRASTGHYGDLADTAAIGFALDTLNTGLTIVLSGEPHGATGYSASFRNGLGDSCGMVVGNGPRPPGMPATNPLQVPVCW